MGGDSIEYFHEDEAFDGETRQEHSPKEAKPQIQSNLARYRWRGSIPDPGEVQDLLRLAKAGSNRAEQELFEGYHRLVLKIAKEYHGPAHDDLVAAGCLGFSKAYDAFRVGQNAPFEPWHEIRNEIRAVAKEWRRRGHAGETRADKYLYHHPHATAEEVVAGCQAWGTPCSLESAHEAIVRQEGYWHGFEHYDTIETGASGTGHDNDEHSGRKQMRVIARVAWQSNRPDIAIDHAALIADRRERARLRLIGRQAFALELVEWERRRGDRGKYPPMSAGKVGTQPDFERRRGWSQLAEDERTVGADILAAKAKLRADIRAERAQNRADIHAETRGRKGNWRRCSMAELRRLWKEQASRPRASAETTEGIPNDRQPKLVGAHVGRNGGDRRLPAGGNARQNSRTAASAGDSAGRPGDGRGVLFFTGAQR